MKKPSSSALVLAVVALLAAGGYYAYREYYAAPKAPQYQTQAVEKGDINQVVAANGTINPVTLVNVGTQVSGTVKKLHVDFNSKVTQGQVLLELDDALLAAQQKQSLANEKGAMAALELAQANEERVRSLYAQEYASRQEMETAEQARKAAEAQLQLARAAVEKDRANLSYSVIRSPVSGVVVERAVDVGQTVAASLQTPTLFKIAQDLSKMQIDAAFAEADIGAIRVGQTVRFTVDAFASRSFSGSVRQIRLSPTIQSNVVTYDVVVDVDNPEQILMPGMTAYVSIAVEERRDVLLVPNAALRYKPADAEGLKRGPRPKRDAYSGTAYVLRGGVLAPVNVTLGITDNRNTEVTGGDLRVGDVVVVGDAFTGKPQTSANPTMRRLF